MRRIGILSLIGREFNDNYGGVFQNYALNSFLNNMMYETYTVDLYPSFKRSLTIRKIISSLKNNGINDIFNKMIFRIKETPWGIDKDLKYLRNREFSSFRKNYIKFTNQSISPGMPCNHLEEYFNLFDILIVGSDQVWNPNLNENMLKLFLLNFPFKGKRLSYAASIGAQVPNHKLKLYEDCLRKFNYLSVREESSADMVKKIIGQWPKIVLDPVFLLSEKEWLLIAQEPKIKLPERYIFIYDIVKSKDIISAINNLAIKYKFRTINYFPYSKTIRRKYNSILDSFYHMGPREFLYLLKNSSFVVSSSYHGVLLSIIFKKNFIAVVPKRNSNLSGMHSGRRILDLLNRLKIENRTIENPKNISIDMIIEKINYDDIDEILELLRKDSIEYLSHALSK